MSIVDKPIHNDNGFTLMEVIFVITLFLVLISFGVKKYREAKLRIEVITAKSEIAKLSAETRLLKYKYSIDRDPNFDRDNDPNSIAFRDFIKIFCNSPDGETCEFDGGSPHKWKIDVPNKELEYALSKGDNLCFDYDHSLTQLIEGICD